MTTNGSHSEREQVLTELRRSDKFVVVTHENPDGEALAWAATRLADHPAERRILIVFSDGYPSTGDGDPQVLRSDLRERIAAIGKRGIELLGIGVLTDAVEDFYPHNVVVSRLAELPSTVFSVLSSMLLTR